MLESDELVLGISDSGVMDLELLVKELKSKISGAGDVSLKGETKLHDIEINGSGDIKAYDLLTNESEIEINGSGDVYYKGNVKEISSEINGSGKLNQQR